MIILGITGGVGSGKSKILYELEEQYNAYIVEADKLAHELMLPGQIIYNNIVATFGETILSQESPGYIDRQKLGNIVFNDKEKLEILNSISHPLVKQRILEIIEEQKTLGTELFVIEAALLIEDGYKAICDKIWYIWVSKEERIKRLMENRGYTREKCISILNSQQDDEFYISNSNIVLDNNGVYEHTSNRIKDLLNKLYDNDIIN